MYSDGVMYEFSVPMGRAEPFFVGPEMIRILFSGSWIGAFEDDYVNYLTVWVPNQVHEHILPNGPPPFRMYTTLDRDESWKSFDEWLKRASMTGKEAEPPGNTGPIKLLEIHEIQRAIEEKSANNPP
jgi:hypothetical protein